MQATDRSALVKEAKDWLAERDLLVRTHWRPIYDILGIRAERRTDVPPTKARVMFRPPQPQQPQRMVRPQRIPPWAQQVTLKKVVIPAPAPEPASPPRVPLWDDATWHTYQQKMLAIDKVANALALAAQNRFLRSGQRNAAAIYHEQLLTARTRFAQLTGPEDGIWDEDAIGDILGVLCNCVKTSIRPMLEGGSGDIVAGSETGRFYAAFTSCVAAYLESLGFFAVGVQPGDQTEPCAKYFEPFLPGEHATSPAQRGCIYKVFVQPYRAYYGAQGQEELSEIWVNGRAAVYQL